MSYNPIYKKNEIAISLVIFIFSFILFYIESKAFIYSLFAAILTGILIGFTYIVIRWIWMATKKN